MFVLLNALTLGLILYITYKFLVPAKQQKTTAQSAGWLRGSETEATSSSSHITSKLPAFLSGVSQEVLMRTLKEHFETTAKEDKEIVMDQLRRASELLTEDDEDIQEAGYSSSVVN